MNAFFQTFDFVLVYVKKLFAEFQHNNFSCSRNRKVKLFILLEYFKLAKRISTFKLLKLMSYSIKFYINLRCTFEHKVNMIDLICRGDNLLIRKINFIDHVVLNNIVKHSHFFFEIGVVLQVVHLLEHIYFKLFEIVFVIESIRSNGVNELSWTLDESMAIDTC